MSVDTLGTSGQYGDQLVPRIAARANGDLVIVWQDNGGNDGSGSGVFGRVYGAATDSLGDIFQVNAYVSGPRTTRMWRIWSMVDSWWSGRIPTDAMVQVTPPSPSATTPAARQWAVRSSSRKTVTVVGTSPKVSALATGGFAVAFYSDNGSGWGDVYLREFDAFGLPVDGDRLGNTDTAGRYQSEPAIASLTGGNFCHGVALGSGSGWLRRGYLPAPLWRHRNHAAGWQPGA